MQFAMHAPGQVMVSVLTGAANLAEFEEVYAAATTPVAEEVRSAFEAEFGVRV